MTEEEDASHVVLGRVKWFDPAKGFGFIVVDDEPSDILLHANILRNFGQSSIADGAGITVRVQRTQRGIQAVEILKIEPPVGEMIAVLMPIRWPLTSTSAPPELPGLMAASV